MTNRLSDLISKLKLCFFLGWKPILYWLFGPKSQSFRNKSGKMQPIPDQIWYTWTCQGVTTFRELWARSVHFEKNSVWDESRGAWVFFVCHTIFRQLRNGRFSSNLVTVLSRNPERHFRKFSLVLTLCGLALRSTRMTRPRVQRTSPWRNPSLWI